ncbi:hypothetical protein Pmani_001012 [Petrolisthes manimaculis]|uniref:Uncharacterized protein n=1 Tax=Petrolisthes manimaculis TaxID=1843537 RepID=A0AAE1URZ6_9EUCA|nr:hypothetical protein Pmani_001012 [Petrolisthes manimaculis]
MLRSIQHRYGPPATLTTQEQTGPRREVDVGERTGQALVPGVPKAVQEGKSFRLWQYVKQKTTTENNADLTKPSSDEASDVPSNGHIPLSLDHVQGVFFILLIGHLISLLAIFTERCLKDFDTVRSSRITVKG